MMLSLFEMPVMDCLKLDQMLKCRNEIVIYDLLLLMRLQ